MMVFCNLFIAKHLDEVNEENREGKLYVRIISRNLYTVYSQLYFYIDCTT